MARLSEYDSETIPNKVLELMSEGVLDIEIYAVLGISKDTFVRWRKTYPELNEAYNQGLAKCEAWWASKGREKFLQGDDTGHKYWNSVMKNKFGYDKQDGTGSVTNNTQINVNTHVNFLEDKNKAELMEYLKDQVLNPYMIPALPSQLIEVIDVESEQSSESNVGRTASEDSRDC